MADNKLMSYLAGAGMQPGALDRLIQKMEQTRGSQPLFNSTRAGFRGNTGALGNQTQMPRMYRGR